LERNRILDPQVVIGPKVGEDAAVIDFGEGTHRYAVVTSDPITFTAHEINKLLKRRGHHVVAQATPAIHVPGARRDVRDSHRFLLGHHFFNHRITTSSLMDLDNNAFKRIKQIQIMEFTKKEAFLKQLKLYLDSKDMKKAYDLSKDFVKKFPNEIESNFFMARFAYEVGQYAESKTAGTWNRSCAFVSTRLMTNVLRY
jgi:hypothetical protein